MGDSDVLVNRWRRYGKDRLYVVRADESKVGWWDLATDEGHPDSPEHLAALVAAVEEWKAGVSRPEPDAGSGELLEPGPEQKETIPEGTPALEDPEVPTPIPVRPWIDLATNLPGAEARDRAQAFRDASPVKTFLARALGVHTDERAWRMGADGEEKVGAQLARLVKKDPRWRVLHAIPVGLRGSDIDHLVIGPGGVFTVNAKHHRGAKIWVGGDTFLVDGHKQPYIRNSRHESARAARLLEAACGFPVHVEGLVVTVNAEDVIVKKPPAGVHVVPRMQVARWLRRHGDIHGEHVVDAIHEVARRSTTWKA